MQREEQTLESLVGKTIKQVRINREDDVLYFLTEGGKVYQYHAYGDCCSRSWIEHINWINFLVDAIVTEVKNRDMPEDDIDKHGNCIAYYGWTIVTNKGRCDIEMRNESNGYYGGSLERTEHDPKTLDDTRPVTEDF